MGCVNHCAIRAKLRKHSGFVSIAPMACEWSAARRGASFLRMVTSDEPWGLEEICDKIHARAYTKERISLEGLSEKKKQTLTHVLRSLLSEREEEVLVREQLLARHRALEHKLEQYERSMKQGEKGSVHAETKLHTLQSQLQYVSLS